MKTVLSLLVFSLIASPVLAEEVAERLAALEASQAELYHTLAEKKAAGRLSTVAGHISLSGLLEVEATVASLKNRDGSTDSNSDLALATAQLGLGFQPLEQVGFAITLLYEGAGSDLEVDEAFTSLTGGPATVHLGQLYLPFGVYYSHFISDPLVLELGETRESALVTEFDLAPVTLSLFAFNGEAEKSDTSEDHVRDWGASVSAAPLEGLEFGGGYLSDLADSDAELLVDEITNPDNLYRDRVAAWNAFLSLEFGRFGLSAEGLGAVDRFHVSDLDADSDGRGDKPFAYNVEAYHQVGGQLEVAARFEESRELASHPHRQYGLCGSWGLHEHLSVSLEYLFGEFDEDFARDGEQQRHLTTLQVAVAL